MRGHIVEIPNEMGESALVDGCNRLGVLWRITLPLGVPGAWGLVGAGARAHLDAARSLGPNTLE